MYNKKIIKSEMRACVQPKFNMSCIVKEIVSITYWKTQ